MFGKISTFVRDGIYVSLYTIDKYILHQSTDIFILCYHSIADNSWKFTISSKEFKKQINFLLQEGYTFITTKDLCLFLDGKKKLPKKSVLLNFDDGYKGLTKIAAFLHDKKIYPTLFMITNTKTPNRKELANNQHFLTTAEVKQLVKMGWELGSHTQTHSNLATLDKQQLIDEINSSKKILEKIFKHDITYFSYPRGKYTREVLSMVRKAGYTFGFTMDDGFVTNKTAPLQIPRIGVDNTHTYSKFKTIYSPSVIKFRQGVKSSPIGKYL